MPFHEAIVRHERRLRALQTQVDEGERRLDEPRRMTAQITELEQQTSSFFKETIDPTNPARDYVISDRHEVQTAWEQAYDQVRSDAEYLERSERKTEADRQGILGETVALKQRWKQARQIRYYDPPPPPKRRRRTFWEVLVRVWKEQRLRALFEWEEILQAEPAEHRVQLDKVLAESLPNPNTIQEALNTVTRQEQESKRLLQRSNELWEEFGLDHAEP